MAIKPLCHRKIINKREENILLNLFTASKATMPIERRELDGVKVKDNEKNENGEDWENDLKRQASRL